MYCWVHNVIFYIFVFFLFLLLETNFAAVREVCYMSQFTIFLLLSENRCYLYIEGKLILWDFKIQGCVRLFICWISMINENSLLISNFIHSDIRGLATIYLQLIQNRYMFRSFTVLQCSHQHCVQPVASDVEVVGYL